MRFIIDGAEWSFPHMESLSREEQLDALKEKVSSEDRVIIDFLSDGESLDENDLLTVPDSLDVDVVTSTPEGLGLQVTEEMNASLSGIFKAMQEILDGSEPYQPHMLDGARDAAEWIQHAAEGIRDAYPDYRGELPDASLLIEGLETFHGLLSDGRYAEAQAWHEDEWKHDLVPPVLSALNEIETWLRKERADPDFSGNDSGERAELSHKNDHACACRHDEEDQATHHHHCDCGCEEDSI